MAIISITVAFKQTHDSYINEIMRQEDFPGTFSTVQIPLKSPILCDLIKYSGLDIFIQPSSYSLCMVNFLRTTPYEI